MACPVSFVEHGVGSRGSASTLAQLKTHTDPHENRWAKIRRRRQPV